MLKLIVTSTVLLGSCLVIAACSGTEDEVVGQTRSAIEPCPSPQLTAGLPAGPICPTPRPEPVPKPPPPPPPTDERPAWAKTTCAVPDGVAAAPADTYLTRRKIADGTCPNLGYVDTVSRCDKGTCYNVERYRWFGAPLFPEKPEAGCQYRKGIDGPYTTANWKLLSDEAVEQGSANECSFVNGAPPPMVWKQCYAQSEPVVVPVAPKSPNADQGLVSLHPPMAGQQCKALGMTDCPNCGMMTGEDAGGTAEGAAPLYLVLDEETGGGGNHIFVGVPDAPPDTWVEFEKYNTNSKHKQFIKVEHPGLTFPKGARLWVGRL